LSILRRLPEIIGKVFRLIGKWDYCITGIRDYQNKLPGLARSAARLGFTPADRLALRDGRSAYGEVTSRTLKVEWSALDFSTDRGQGGMDVGGESRRRLWGQLERELNIITSTSEKRSQTTTTAG